ncbi:MAG: TonB-dependent receptor, partial [Burkholderiales bacterium]|nr:TonB-dependent receptor [Burkholderiales bacterium]
MPHVMKQISLACALCLPALSAHAQSAEEDDLARIYGDKAFVSIATGARQPLSRAPAVTTVITADDIAKMGATDLNTALEMVPGMHVERAAFYYSPIYVMRGIYSVNNIQVLVLLNGVPMVAANPGVRGIDLGDMPLEHVARIEVIRGPASALYGADAYSGVINVITKSPADLHGSQVGARYGSFASRDVWLEHGGKIGGLALSAFLHLGTSAGSKEIIDADAQSARDKIFHSHASLAPGPVSRGMDAADVSLEASYQHWWGRLNYLERDNIGTGAGIASSLDPIGKQKTQRAIYELGWAQSQFVEGWDGNAQISYVDLQTRLPESVRLAPPGTVLASGIFPDGQLGHPEISEYQLGISGNVTYSGFAQHKMRIGIGHEDHNLYQTATFKNYVFNANGVPVPVGALQDFSSIQPFLLPQRRKLNYLYLQDEWQLANDWTITGGIRHDRYSDFGSTTNP